MEDTSDVNEHIEYIDKESLAERKSNYENDDITISSQTSTEKININEELDNVLSQLGHFGRFQKLLYFGLWLPACGMAAGAYASLYMEWSPTYLCLDDTTFPASLSQDTCYRADNETQCSTFLYDTSLFSSSVVTEFDLVCDRMYLQTVSKTVYMLGMLLGSMSFGWLGDKFGRRIAFLISSLFLSIGSIICSLAFNIESYIIFRFLTSFGGMGLFITCFVIALEFVGPKARTGCGVAMQIPFALGQLYVVFIGYFVRDWRLHQATLAATFLIFPFYLAFIPESIRWLLSKKRNESACKILNKVGDFNNVVLPELVVNNDDTIGNLNDKEQTAADSSQISSIIIQPKLRLRFLVMALNWAVTTLGYYGLGLSSTSLTADPFLSLALSAAMEIPGYLFCVFSLDVFGRKRILAFSQMLTGTMCILAAILPAEYRTISIALTLAGKFGASAAFSIVYVYTAEMFHTPVRNSAIGLCSTSARIGGLLAPTIASLAATDPLLPFLIMGCCCCLGIYFIID